MIIGPDCSPAPEPVAFVNAQASIDIAKNREGEDSQSVVSGGTVTWTIAVTNTGNVTLTNVTIGDEQVPYCAAGNIGTLVPGQVYRYTCSSDPVASGFVNVATATGTPPEGENVIDSDPSTVVVLTGEPAIDLEKATNGEDADNPNGPLVDIGSTVTWTYVVTNTGGVVLDSIRITDSVEGPINCPETTLAPGASMICTLTGTAQAGQYANGAEVTGRDPQGRVVRDDDNSHYVGVSPDPLLAVLGDWVWFDSNRNGLQDAGEPGVPGVAVTLYDAAGEEVATTTTDANGFYLFDRLEPGSYFVSFTRPEGTIFTEANVQGNSRDDIDSDAQGPTLTLSVATPSAEVRLGERLTYTLNFESVDSGNNGAGAALVISTTVPAGTVFVPSAGSAGWVCEGNAAVAGTNCTHTVVQGVAAPGAAQVAAAQATAQFVVQLGTEDDAVPEVIELQVTIGPETARTTLVTLAGGERNLTVDAGLVPITPVVTETPRRPGPTNLEETDQPRAPNRLFLPSVPN